MINQKLIYQRLCIFLKTNEVLYTNQFGFRKKHSTNNALIDNTEKIRDLLDKKLFTCGIFIDLQKTFHTVYQEVLLDKLHYYSIKGTANNWFNTFLKNRYQFTDIKENSSKNQKKHPWCATRFCIRSLTFSSLHKWH